MLKMNILFAAAAIAVTSAPAFSAEIGLSKSKQAGVINETSLDMVVYYVDRDPGLEVVATYTAKDTPDEPRRMTMLLENGDDVRFSLPGHPATEFNFVRNGGTVVVSTKPTQREVSSADD